MNEIQRERLLRVRDVMMQMAMPKEMRSRAYPKSIRKSKFNIMSVGTYESGWIKWKLRCGCVIGLATQDPVLQEQGLGFMIKKVDVYGKKHRGLKITLDGEETGYSSLRLSKFFGLSLTDYQNLVNPYGYGTGCFTKPSAVVRRIEMLIQNYSAESQVKARRIRERELARDPADLDLVTSGD